jgi:excisionase family DNA binding protein
MRQHTTQSDLLANDVLRAAARLGISRSKLYAEMNSGRLAFIKIGGRRLVTDEALRQYLADRQRETLTRT